MKKSDRDRIEHRHEWSLRIHNRDIIPVWLWIGALVLFGLLVGFAAV